jgi:hypothetical protein
MFAVILRDANSSGDEVLPISWAPDAGHDDQQAKALHAASAFGASSMAEAGNAVA